MDGDEDCDVWVATVGAIKAASDARNPLAYTDSVEVRVSPGLSLKTRACMTCPPPLPSPLPRSAVPDRRCQALFAYFSARMVAAEGLSLIKYPRSGKPKRHAFGLRVDDTASAGPILAAAVATSAAAARTLVLTWDTARYDAYVYSSMTSLSASSMRGGASGHHHHHGTGGGAAAGAAVTKTGLPLW